mmetsp:Transcript_14200/g.59830  ORF Transcript_14200/g.59830 Transcript_14200/m.59830 type:complete len:283 (+) Transcript_14200:254-1102(+)
MTWPRDALSASRRVEKRDKASANAAVRALLRTLPLPPPQQHGRHAHLPRHPARARQGARGLHPRVPLRGGARLRGRRWPSLQVDERHRPQHQEQPRRRDHPQHRRQGVHHHRLRGRRGHREGQVRPGVPRAHQQGGDHRGGPHQLRRGRQLHVHRRHEPRADARPGHRLPGAHGDHQRPRRDGGLRRRHGRRGHRPLRRQPGVLPRRHPRRGVHRRVHRRRVVRPRRAQQGDHRQVLPRRKRLLPRRAPAHGLDAHRGETQRPRRHGRVHRHAHPRPVNARR